jgi:hypothetical protein
MVFEFLKYRELRGKELEKRAEELGVSLDETWDVGGERPILKEPELQRRVREAERARRDRNFWIVALVSSIASACSAVAAWIAVLKRVSG